MLKPENNEFLFFEIILDRHVSGLLKYICLTENKTIMNE